MVFNDFIKSPKSRAYSFILVEQYENTLDSYNKFNFSTLQIDTTSRLSLVVVKAIKIHPVVIPS